MMLQPAGTSRPAGTYSGWLTKVKGDKALARWWSSTTKRYYTIDFDTERLYYSHHEDRRDKTNPVHFGEILGAELLPPSSKGTGGFAVKTTRRSFELRAASRQHAIEWVNALQSARQLVVRSSGGGVEQALGQTPDVTRRTFAERSTASFESTPSQAPQARSIDWSVATPGEEFYASAVGSLPCMVWHDAADQVCHAAWANMPRRERLTVAGEEVTHHPVQLDASRVLVADAATGSLAALSKLDRLERMFRTNDSLQALVGHHLDHLVVAVAGAMSSRSILPGEVVMQRDQEHDSLYIVDEGTLEVVVQRSAEPPVLLCHYGAGSVFGELALASGSPRAAPRASTVRASTPCRVWTLDHDTFRAALRIPEGAKTIGLMGGVMMLVNSLAGRAVVSMPALAQEAGWLAFVMVQAAVATLATACGYMMLGAMQRLPGNSNFEQRIEFTNLSVFYLPRCLHVAVMTCYHVNIILSLMSLIIQSGQVMDYLMVSTNGCAPGLELGPRFGYICGARTDSVTPFGERIVLSGSMLVVAAVCAPFAVKDLEDSVALQYLAVVGLSFMASMWVAIMVAEPVFPRALPAVTASQSGLVGAVLFNFALTSMMPSLVNEKRPDTSMGTSLGLAMIYFVLIYSVVGIMGGMAFQPFSEMDENFFSKISAGSTLGQATVTAYPILQNFTSIPVLSVMLRCNLIQSGFKPSLATMIAIGLPWVLSVPFYSDRGFDTFLEVGGFFTSSVINYIVPMVMYAAAKNRFDRPGVGQP